MNPGVPRISFFSIVCLALLFTASLPAFARQNNATVRALFVSDTHFDPFWDPAKAPQLAAAPVSAWPGILASAPSAHRQQQFDALQEACKVRGEDTSFPLLQSSLNAMQAHASGALFMTLSGDLIAHGFSCKFKSLFPAASPDAYRAFVEKTIAFVLHQLNTVAPVYAALGNNDSACGDYRLDANSPFLAAVGADITRIVPAAQRPQALASFQATGSYSVSLPAPIANTRFVILDDLFMSKKYATCSGQKDPAGEDAELAWLRQQLAGARAAGQKVWIMGHIPPGVDAHATLARLSGACGSKPPSMFLSSDKLSAAIAGGSDVVTLAIFAHTHMDEIKLLTPQSESPAAPNIRNAVVSSTRAVPLKMVPSISPIDGNNPAFTVAEIDPSTATLMDYQVIAAQDPAGSAWAQEYDYAASYGEPSFSAQNVAHLLNGFAGDTASKNKVSQDYIHHFMVGSPIPFLSPVWSQYVCTMTRTSADAFRSCACPATP